MLAFGFVSHPSPKLVSPQNFPILRSFFITNVIFVEPPFAASFGLPDFTDFRTN